MSILTISLTPQTKVHLHFAGLDQFGDNFSLVAPVVTSLNPVAVAWVPDADGLGGFAVGLTQGGTTLTVTDQGVSAEAIITVSEAPAVLTTIVVTADAVVPQ